MMGWSVTIADNRKSYLQAQRFPHAEQLYLIPSSGDISGLQINSDDTVVMMTHNYPQSCCCCRSSCRWILVIWGCLAPHPRGKTVPRKSVSRRIAPTSSPPSAWISAEIIHRALHFRLRRKSKRFWRNDQAVF